MAISHFMSITYYDAEISVTAPMSSLTEGRAVYVYTSDPRGLRIASITRPFRGMFMQGALIIH